MRLLSMNDANGLWIDSYTCFRVCFVDSSLLRLSTCLPCSVLPSVVTFTASPDGPE